MMEERYAHYRGTESTRGTPRLRESNILVDDKRLKLIKLLEKSCRGQPISLRVAVEINGV
jgi:hypothetical protein